MKTGQKITWMRNLGKGPLTTGTIKYILELEEPIDFKNIDLLKANLTNEIQTPTDKDYIVIAVNEKGMFWMLKKQIKDIQ